MHVLHPVVQLRVAACENIEICDNPVIEIKTELAEVLQMNLQDGPLTAHLPPHWLVCTSQ